MGDDRNALIARDESTRTRVRPVAEVGGSGQIADHVRQRQFTVVSLKITRQCDARPALGLGIARALQKEIRIATEIVALRERYRIDPILEQGTAGVAAVLVREGKNLKGRVLGLVLGTIGKRVLRRAFENTVKAVEARNDAATKVGAS